MERNDALMVVVVTLVLVLVLTFTANDAHGQATIVVNNLDSAGEGFNDPTPASPVGGNPGTTRGQQRLNAFQYAADILAGRLESPVTIYVDARMDPQTCTPTSAVLGSAGTKTIHRNFSGALLSNTWYPQALANSLAGVDLSPANADITATFNSNLTGDPGCLGGKGWYYGYDQNPGSDIDFVTVVLHEVSHGLGFQTFVSQSGAKYGGYDDAYMVHLEHHSASPPDYPSMSDAGRAAANVGDPNLHWLGAHALADQSLSGGMSGGHVRIHGPNPYQGGSSVSHWSTALAPNEVMEPSYTGANHDPGLAQSLFQDIGWALSPTVSVAITSFHARFVDGGVKVHARFSSTYDVVGVSVYRADGEGNDFARLELASADGGGEFVYVDDAVQPGRSYTYMIGVTDGDGEFFSPAANVTVPDIAASLDANVPNPFNPTTTIRYTLPSRGPVTLTVFDAKGRVVRTLVAETKPAGAHHAVWDGRDDDGAAVASGIYFCRLQAGAFAQSRKMVLLK